MSMERFVHKYEKQIKVSGAHPKPEPDPVTHTITHLYQ